MSSVVLMIAGPHPAECAAPGLALNEDFAEFNLSSSEFQNSDSSSELPPFSYVRPQTQIRGTKIKISVCF